MTRRRRKVSESGAAMVEMPLVIIVMSFIALGFLCLAQLLLAYQHVTSASRAAARFAARSEFDPDDDPNDPGYSTRRPTSTDVQVFGRDAAAGLPDSEVGVQLYDPSTGVVSFADSSNAACLSRPSTLDTNGDGTHTPGVDDNANGRAGNGVVVSVCHVVDDGAWKLIADFTNGLGGLLGFGDVMKPITLHSEASAVYE